MHLSFEITNFDKSITLEQGIDNRARKQVVKVTSLIYWVGYYNILRGDKMRIRDADDSITEYLLEPGLYNFQQLKEAMNLLTDSITMDLNRTAGRIKITAAEGKTLKLSENLATLLNIDPSWLSGEIFGKIDLQPFKAIYLHCDQVSASENVFNGKPSTILEIIPVGDKAFGSSVHIELINASRKTLIPGIINEFKFSIQDSAGNSINNHSLPFILTLEVN